MLRLVGIGALGNMLSPAAEHLSKDGSPGRFIRIYDRNPTSVHKQQRREAWLHHGAKLVNTYEDLICNDDFDGIVICAGKNGDDIAILQHLIELIEKHFSKDKRPFILHCSTVSTEFVESAYTACKEVQIAYANYPLTGGAKGASAGTMLILASGEEKLYKKLLPLLSFLGKPKYFGEGVSSAARVKFMGHLMVFNGLIGMTSAILLQMKTLDMPPLEQEQFFDFLNQGAGGTRQWEVTLKQAVAQDNWQHGFLLLHAVIDAIYTGDLLCNNAMPCLTIQPVLNIAAIFNYLLQGPSSHQLATQTVLKVLWESSDEVEKFRRSLEDPDSQKYLQNIIQALPATLYQKVKLNICPEDFWG